LNGYGFRRQLVEQLERANRGEDSEKGPEKRAAKGGEERHQVIFHERERNDDGWLNPCTVPDCAMAYYYNTPHFFRPPRDFEV
jgi:hypothetical protein